MRYVRHALLTMLSFNAKSDLYMCMKSESIETKSIDEKTYNKKKHCACVSALHEHKEMCTHANDLEWGLMLVEIKAYSLCLNIAIKLLLKHRGLNKMAAILQTTFWNVLVKKMLYFQYNCSELGHWYPNDKEAITDQWPLLLTWFNFNPSMDK